MLDDFPDFASLVLAHMCRKGLTTPQAVFDLDLDEDAFVQAANDVLRERGDTKTKVCGMRLIQEDHGITIEMSIQPAFPITHIPIDFEV